jgi:hypothetical protein
LHPVTAGEPLELKPKHEFYLIAMRRGEWPNPWIWEIFYRGGPLTDRIWGGYFKSETKALAAGQPTLNEILDRIGKTLI